MRFKTFPPLTIEEQATIDRAWQAFAALPAVDRQRVIAEFIASSIKRMP